MSSFPLGALLATLPWKKLGYGRVNKLLPCGPLDIDYLQTCLEYT
jgi:hypothetical protein